MIIKDIIRSIKAIILLKITTIMISIILTTLNISEILPEISSCSLAS